MQFTDSPIVGASGRSHRIAIVAACLLLLAAAATTRAQDEGGTAEDRGMPPEWVAVIERYTMDPVRFRGEVLAIEREANGATLPPEVQVYVADAYLRSGRPDAAQRVLEQTLASNPPYPWDVFAKLGMGGARMMRGDPDGALPYFEDVADLPSESANLFGNLGLGHALLASGRPMDAKEAFDAAGENGAVDSQFREAGQFGSATALYAAGDFEGAAQAFDAIASRDPKGPIGLDARFAAARARLAMGDREAATKSLESMESRCADKKSAGRSPRALRNLDARAFSRTWLRNYQTMSWRDALGADSSMYTIGGCDLARATLRRLRASGGSTSEFEAPLRLREAAVRPVTARDARSAPGTAGATGPAPRGGESGTSWLPWTVGTLVLVSIVLLLRRRAG